MASRGPRYWPRDQQKAQTWGGATRSDHNRHRVKSRLCAAVLAPFRERSTSFVVDAMNGRGALPHEIKPLDPSSRFVGSALTARAGARDNLAALAALDLVQPGAVLVIGSQVWSGAATLGDNIDADR